MSNKTSGKKTFPRTFGAKKGKKALKKVIAVKTEEKQK
jgi:hypothetical protein